MAKGRRKTRQARASFAIPPVLIPPGAIFILYLLGSYLPPHWSWGFDYWRLVPSGLALVVLCLAFTTLLPGVREKLSAALEPLFTSISRSAKKLNRTLLVTGVSILLFLLFMIFRSQAHVYGDGFLVLDITTNPYEQYPFSEYYMKPLVILFYRAMYALLAGLMDVEPVKLMAAISAVGGVLGFWSLYSTCRMLTSRAVERWFVLLCALSGGGVILFFGYIENYTWPVALSLWTVTFTIGHAKGKNGIWPALLAGAVGTGFHIFVLPFLAVAVLTWWAVPRHQRSAPIPFARINTGAVILSALIVLAVQIFTVESVFVRLWPTADNGYWVLGASNLLDMLNESILIAPIGVVVVVMLLLKLSGRGKRSLEENLLISFVVFSFLVSFWINPELGAARDWDLLSFYGFPLSLWAGLHVTARNENLFRTATPLVPVAAVVLLALIPNLAEKNSLETAATRLDRVLWHDPHYSADYGQGYNASMWAGTLVNNVGDFVLPTRYLVRAARAEGAPERVFAALGAIYARRGVSDSACAYYSRALEMKPPENDELLNVLVSFEIELGRYDQALIHARQSVQINPGRAENYRRLGLVLTRLDRFEEALGPYRQAWQMEPEEFSRWLNLGMVHGRLEDYDSAHYYLTHALELAGAEAFKPADYYALFSCSVAIGEFEDARLSVDALERMGAGTAEEIGYLRTVLEQAIDSAGAQN